MTRTTFTIREFRDNDAPEVRRIVTSVLVEFGLACDGSGVDADLQDIHASYIACGGRFRIIEDEHGAVAGCGGLFPLDAEEAEIRKMYFLPAARGHGLGRQLLRELIDDARDRRFKRVVLETASVLKTAIALYRSFGFTPAARAHLANRCDQAYELELVEPARQAEGPA